MSIRKLSFIILFPFFVQAQVSQLHPKVYFVTEKIGVISIDGLLTSEEWEGASWSDLFVDISGSQDSTVEFETRFKALWDSSYLYIGADIRDPMVWGVATEKNVPIYHIDNDFEVFIDPDGDHHNYYELELNALNTIWELSLDKPYRDGGNPRDPDNLPGLRTAVHIMGSLNDETDLDTGWTVEIAIPWKALKKFQPSLCPPHKGDNWRINFSRVQWDHEIKDGIYERTKGKAENNWVWSPQGEINMHAPENWGYFIFEGIDMDPEEFYDPNLSIRYILVDIYKRQKFFFKLYHYYATSLEELDKELLPGYKINFKISKDGFVTSLQLLDNNQYTFYINQNSRFWKVNN